MEEKTTHPGYETEDVQTSKLLWAGVVLAAVILVSVAAMTVMFGVLESRRAPEVNAVGPMADMREKPEGPILQVDPSNELIEVRATQSNQIATYGYVNREAGVVRIPVERAMQLVVERGIR